VLVNSLNFLAIILLSSKRLSASTVKIDRDYEDTFNAGGYRDGFARLRPVSCRSTFLAREGFRRPCHQVHRIPRRYRALTATFVRVEATVPDRTGRSRVPAASAYAMQSEGNTTCNHPVIGHHLLLDRW
jgi:hypothetical protein